MAKAKNKINDKQMMFIDELSINGWNATAAYMKVYPNSSYEAARADAARLLTNANIKAEVEARKEEYKAKFKIDQEYIVNEYLLLIANCKTENDRRTLNGALANLMKLTGNDIQRTELTVNGPIKLTFGNGFIPGETEENDDGE